MLTILIQLIFILMNCLTKLFISSNNYTNDSKKYGASRFKISVKLTK